MNNFTYSKDGLHLTEGSEGCRLVAYHGECDREGLFTIGYGHTKDVNDGDTCTQAEAEQFLAADIKDCADAVNRDVEIDLTQEEFDALVDFAFNLGINALEHSTLWKKLNAGDIDGAAAEFPKWDRAGGKEVAGLLTRRLAEQAEFVA